MAKGFEIHASKRRSSFLRIKRVGNHPLLLTGRR